MTTYRTAVADTHSGKFRQSITIGPHALDSDKPVEEGGEDGGPRPFEWLAAGLAACTSMTVKSWAEMKQLSLRRVHVEVTVVHDGERTTFEKQLRLEGALDDAQREGLVEISKLSPVHKALMGAITIETRLV